MNQTVSMLEVPQVTVHASTPHIFCLTTTTIQVCICDGRDQKIPEIHVYTHGIDIILLLPFDTCGIPHCSTCRYPTHILPDHHEHTMCICNGKSTQKSLKLTFIQKNSTFHCFYAQLPPKSFNDTDIPDITSDTTLQSWRYARIKPTQVPYTYFAPQPLSYHVYW